MRDAVSMALRVFARFYGSSLRRGGYVVTSRRKINDKNNGLSLTTGDATGKTGATV